MRYPHVLYLVRPSPEWTSAPAPVILIASTSRRAAQTTAAHRLGLFHEKDEQPEFTIELAMRGCVAGVRRVLVLGRHFAVVAEAGWVELRFTEEFRRRRFEAPEIARVEAPPGAEARVALSWSKRTRCQVSRFRS